MMDVPRHLSAVIPGKAGSLRRIENDWGVAPGFPIAPLTRSVGNDNREVD